MRSKQKDRGKSSSEITLNKKIVAPEKLKILVLTGNDLLNQHLEFLTKCVNLVKLDISHNHITRLPQREAISNLSKLQVAFLHFNKINSLQAIRPIYGCDRLVHLTYHHNPIEVHIKNEHQIVNQISSLKLLNSRVVFLQERTNIIFPSRNHVYADQTFLESWKSTENSEAYYLKVLNLHLNYIDNLWTFNNPIIIIQRIWTNSLRQRVKQNQFQEGLSFKVQSSKKRKRNQPPTYQFNQKTQSMRKIFVQWKIFVQGLKNVKQALKKCYSNQQSGRKLIDKSYLSFAFLEYQRQLRNMKVREPMMKFINKIRRKIYQTRMAQRLIANLRLKQVLFGGYQSFYNISGVKASSRIYYNKNQEHILDNFLHIIAEKFGKKAIQKAICKPSKRYKAIRLVDPETYSNRFHSDGTISLSSLIWPSMKLVICQYKRGISAFKGGIIRTKQLSYIKNRNKVLTKAQLKKSTEVYNRLQKFALNEYQNSLWEFECIQEDTMRHLFRLIYYHNSKALKFQVKNTKSQMLALMRNYQQPLMIYVDEVVKRTAAAVLIQKTWRRYVSNKSQPQSIYNKINQNRAALHIQKFYRNYRYFHRLRLNKIIHQNLGFLNSSTILYPVQLYLYMQVLDKQKYGNKLFKQVRLSRSSEGVGVNEQFYRPIFQKRIRDLQFGGKMIGTENYDTEIDLYNLLHYKVEVSLVQSHIGTMIQLKFPNQIQANIAVSLIALLTYQPRGSHFVWPFTLANIHNWSQQLKQLQKIQFVSRYLHFPKINNKPYGNIPIKSIETKGTFIYKQNKGIPEFNQDRIIKVQFYQKKYQNFPVKHQQTLRYMQLEKDKPTADEEKQYAKNFTSVLKIKQQQSKVRFGSDGAISIRTINKQKFNLFQQQQKKKKNYEGQTAFLNKTVSVIQQKKKQVKKFYQEGQLRKEAQKELKEVSLSALRQKAKQEKMLNTTLKSLKEAQRTQQLRNKVNKIKEIKQQNHKANQEQDFVQQNNFVMQQQLKMIMMRAHIKQTEKKREEHSQKKSSFNHTQHHFTPSLHSRHSEKRKAPIEEQEKLEGLGEEGSVVNVRKRVRRGRAQSIGAYVRDPSFVHGVFPEEYYPIQNRATKFYFPPVL